MNQPPGDGWSGPPGPPPHHGNPENNVQHPQGRPFGNFGPGAPQQQVSQPHVVGNVLLPPSYHPPGPPSSHALPTLADLTQANQPPAPHHHPSPYNTHPPPPNAGPPLPALGHPLQQSSQGLLNQDREREARERERRDMEMLDRQRQREELHVREQERLNRERELADRVHREQMQHRSMQNHTGSIPIHQPVPSTVSNHIHGANGLLSHMGAASTTTNSMPGGNGPTGSATLVSQQPENTSRPAYLHQNVPPPPLPQQQQPMPIFPGPGPAPVPGHAAIGQQQPILNDALSYLDQVKVRFNDQPDVYNRFLDIMKDFKSQAIDTPGVIERVSTLFNGHPALIQGFNTFLPPGYRIECGTDDNPDAIRVTTPSGTTTQSLQVRSRPAYETSALNTSMGTAPARQDTLEQGRQSWMQHQSIMAQPSPSGRPTNAPTYSQQQGMGIPAYDGRHEQDAANAALVHQQEQRGVSQLQNAISVATNGTAGRPHVMHISPGPGQPSTMSQQAVQGLLPGQPGDPKRGPVEFNHAISYVNKIKNRFMQQPDIYKQFLDILQTYQRESKPIQDVYAQVTQLFHTAPDLLEDFKQFLPESAAQAKARDAARAAADEALISNVRGDYAAGQVAQAQTPRPSTKMPPMGQFDPPSTSKENKKRRGGLGAPPATQIGPSSAFEGMVATQGGRGGPVQMGNGSKSLYAEVNSSSTLHHIMPSSKVTNPLKRAKLNHPKPIQADAQNVSPSLVPQLPEPLPPQSSLATNQDELAFFDRVKKFISNKNNYTEFLKLLNLFSQDLIDKNTLADRVSAFIGANPDLMNFFNRMIHIGLHEETVEARAKPDPGRVNLSHCRSLGPSYRHLPKREQHKLCRGRDEMCFEVLNDEWASHPTWASEDSGFVAHRKNQYEDGLHRLEEERHDYDFHIESCQRTIQLMEPLLQQIRLMSESDRARFAIDEKLGGQSKAIPTRIVNKIYGPQAGKTVMAQMIARPASALPIVLSRLKQKLEEWKQSQREWEKVWREQSNKFFWKSLDHQGINAKNLDKKNFQQKTLTSEIQAKYDERKKFRETGYQQVAHQFEYAFPQQETLLDASHLVLYALEKDRANYNSGEQERIGAFLTRFVTAFFGLETPVFKEFMSDIQEQTSNGDVDEEGNGEEAVQQRFLKANMRKADILYRLALSKQSGKESSIVTGSKESTPARGPMSELEVEDDPMTDADVVADVAARRWMDHPNVVHGTKMRRYRLDEPYDRDEFSLYANANIYCFFRLFETLYSRLVAIKEHEVLVHEDVKRAMGENGQSSKAAVSLKMVDKSPGDYFVDVGPKASYYRQIIAMCEEVLAGTLDLSHLEDTLRRFYMKKGWQLYTIDRLLAAINRFIMNILSSDPKDKSTDIINLFYKDRERSETTRTQERYYRKQVQKLAKEGEVYRIRYNPKTTKATIQLFPSNDDTFSSEKLDEEARWSVYVTSYQMLDPTEGVPHSKVGKSFLLRNLDPDVDVDAMQSEDRQELWIDVPTYRIIFTYNGIPGRPFAYVSNEDSSETAVEMSRAERAEAEEVLKKQAAKRAEKMREKFVTNVAWMQDKSVPQVESRKARWQRALDEGLWKVDLQEDEPEAEPEAEHGGGEDRGEGGAGQQEEVVVKTIELSNSNSNSNSNLNVDGLNNNGANNKDGVADGVEGPSSPHLDIIT